MSRAAEHRLATWETDVALRRFRVLEQSPPSCVAPTTELLIAITVALDKRLHRSTILRIHCIDRRWRLFIPTTSPIPPPLRHYRRSALLLSFTSLQLYALICCRLSPHSSNSLGNPISHERDAKEQRQAKTATDVHVGGANGSAISYVFDSPPSHPATTIALERMYDCSRRQ